MSSTFYIIHNIYARLTQVHPSQPQTAQKHNTRKKHTKTITGQKTTKTITRQKNLKIQAHVLKCHHCKNPYGFEYGNKVETGTQT